MTTVANFANRLTTFRPAMNSFAKTLCRDAILAEDLVQETLLKAWMAREHYRDGNCKAWLFTIMRNHYYSQLRHEKFERNDPGNAVACQSVPACDEQPLLLRDVLRAIVKLPADQREALTLIYSDGLSYKQAAKKCHCAVGTIKSRVARAREKLTCIYP